MPGKQKRKCAKCGATSKESGVFLYRFPIPGVTNVLKCEAWARYCFPDSPWSSPQLQKELHSEHRMLCHKHFKQTSFIDFEKKRLHKHAIPDAECDTLFQLMSMPEPNATPSTSQEVFYDITNIKLKVPDDKSKMSAAQPEQVQIAKTKTVTQGSSYTESLTTSKETDITLTPEAAKIVEKKELNKKYNISRTLFKKIWQLCNSLKKSKSLKQNNIIRILTDEDDVKKLQKIISPTFALLLQGQIKNYAKKSKTRRWSPENKIIALRLYKRSPTCYRLLRRMFCLPAPSSLKQMLRHFEMKPGINERVLTTIKKYIEKQKPSDNEFILMFDEMTIKKHIQYNKKNDEIEGFQDHGHHGKTGQEAVKALVFMIVGIRKTVKQPLAYYLSGANVTADRLMVLVKEILQACFKAGLNVSATVCDMATTNRRALESLGASLASPVMTVENRKVVALFDAPHLLKCFRNKFLKYDIRCKIDVSSTGISGEGVAKWSDIKDFFEKDNANPNFVYAPSLKKEHLEPNTNQKMKVSLAAQVLSSSVAGGMFAQISQGQLSASAVATANVVLKMDKLFDLCNSSSPDLRRGKMHSTNMSDTSPHINFFKEMKKFFEEIEFVGCPRKPPSIEGWLWTMNAIQIIWRNLKCNYKDIKSLATRRLQQDPLENLFGSIRENCGSNTNPTTSGFVGGIKTTVISNLTQVTSSNCEDDKNEAIMKKFKTLVSTPKQEVMGASPLVPHLESNIDLLNAIEEPNEDSGEMQACAYVCGYLIKNNKTQLEKCEMCKNIVIAPEPSFLHSFVQNKEYDELKNYLNYATKDLVLCVEKCASLINALLAKESHKKELKNHITRQIPKEIFDFLETCPGHLNENEDYLKSSVFHICVHRYCTLKNREYSSEGTRLSLHKKMKKLKNI